VPVKTNLAYRASYWHTVNSSGRIVAGASAMVRIDQIELGVITEFFSFMLNGNNFTSKDQPGSIQMRSGFMDFFDPAVALLGMDINTEIIVFRSGGYEYRLQTWDGQYGWSSMLGGEVALYRRPISEADDMPYTPCKDLSLDALRSKLPYMSTAEMNNYFISYSSLPEEDQIPITMTIYKHSGGLVLTNDTRDYATNETHYWNYATVPNTYGLGKDDIAGIASLEIEDPELRNDLLNALEDAGYSPSRSGNSVEFYWGRD
jgi:hypothetical protein